MSLQLPNGPYCKGCVLEKSGRGFMQLDGTGTNGVMIVAEALGYNEAIQGKPLVGPAGFLFNRVLKRHVKEPRENFYIANTIFCKPPGNNLQGTRYKYAAIDHCRPHLDQAIDSCKPRAIVAMGDIAMERLLGIRGIQKKQNYAYWAEQYNCWVVPSLHPSFIQRGQHKYQPVLGHAIKKAIRIATEGYEHEEFKTIVQPTAAELEEYIRRYKKALAIQPGLPLAFDIETDYKGERDESNLKDNQDPTYTILQISFAFGPFEGIALEWNESLKTLIQQLFDIAPQTIVWNRSYDVPRIIANGVIIRAPIRDSMIAWHALNSDLDKGLGFVTPLIPGNHQFPQWKDQSSVDGGWHYSALDSIALWRNDDGIMKSLREQGGLAFFQKYVEGVRPVLDDMEQAGMLVDTQAQHLFIQRMAEELGSLEKQMHAIVPTELLGHSPDKGYKRTPLDTENMRRITIPNQRWTVCPACHMKNPPKAHFKKYVSKKSLHKNTKCSDETPMQMQGNEVRWANIVPFKPSPKQLLKYAHHKGYTLKKNWKTEAYTMDEETLSAMIKRYKNEELFPLVLQHRSAQKLYGLYGPDGMLIKDDGRVHTSFSDNPSTFRFSSYGPNMQNIPRGNPDDANDASNYIRNLFVAQPGSILGARDYSGIEAVLVGYFAGDQNYVRLAKIGVHDYFNAHRACEAGDILASDLPDLSWSDADLTDCLLGFKQSLKSTRPVAKSAVHGSNYLETPFMMYRIAPHLYENVKAAARVQDQYFELFSSIPKWQHHTCAQAEKQGYVMGPYGIPHRFYQVYDWKKDAETGQWVSNLGSDAKRAVAYKPQHTAAAIMRRAILLLGDTFVREYLRLTIHDELLWETPKDINDQVDAKVKEIMERPQPELPLPTEWGMGEHLTIGTEGKHGVKWGKMC